MKQVPAQPEVSFEKGLSNQSFQDSRLFAPPWGEQDSAELAAPSTHWESFSKLVNSFTPGTSPRNPIPLVVREHVSSLAITGRSKDN